MLLKHSHGHQLLSTSVIQLQQLQDMQISVQWDPNASNMIAGFCSSSWVPQQFVHVKFCQFSDSKQSGMLFFYVLYAMYLTEALDLMG